MKKVIFGFLISIITNLACAGAMGVVLNPYQWNGFYLGGNMGNWWSQDDAINSVGSVNLVNAVIPVEPSDLANALALIGTNHFVKNNRGFMGGGQIGFNYQQSHVVASLDADFDGLTNSNINSNVSKIVPLVNFPAQFYTATITANKKIDYLGAVRGRLGFLFYNPSILVYGIGGFAYGGVSLGETFFAEESLGPLIYPAVFTQKNSHELLTGWTAGGGIEWKFVPQWSAKIEYSYYNLGSINHTLTLNQINNAIPPVLWAVANVNTSTQFTANTVRLGINYHFGC